MNKYRQETDIFELMIEGNTTLIEKHLKKEPPSTTTDQ